jgi:NAD+-dependent protein deacetylase sirtuin 4
LLPPEATTAMNTTQLDSTAEQRMVTGGDGVGGIDALARLLGGRRFVALTGAGCSTESGIPDYRGNGRSGPRDPIQHDAYMRNPEVRRRYWARATIGWQRFRGARPNAAHRALATLEAAGHLAGVITQNVDRLHSAAGSRRVVELHGALADVRCLGCRRVEPREAVHERLLVANPGWLDVAGDVIRYAPDGDADLPTELVDGFQVVGCATCGDVLKPDVVFFGGSVAEPTLADAFALADEGSTLVVVGSSLTVYSGYRFVKHARERGIAVAVINDGPTRADPVADLRLAARAGQALSSLARALGVPVA